jgi:hypothetical protein
VQLSPDSVVEEAGGHAKHATDLSHTVDESGAEGFRRHSSVATASGGAVKGVDAARVVRL